MSDSVDYKNLMKQGTSPLAAGVDHESAQMDSDENPYLAQPESGLKLCASLLSDSNRSGAVEKSLQAFSTMIEQQFLEHSEDSGNTAGANTYANLLALKRRLAEMANFPLLEEKYTVSVGGSFSAGKSRFLNSVLGCPSLLPTDTTPTTSIPTYLFQGAVDSIYALNVYHKKTEIDEDALKAICHAFNQKFGVTFSHLLQLVAVQRKYLKFPHLVFLDTPGYSKSDDVNSEANSVDKNIAREHLRSTDYLIWLVDQQNGTVPQPDLDFIAELELEQPILVVISKADKRPKTAIMQVIAKAKEDLADADIEYVDVIAYSADRDCEISETGNVLQEFLEKIDQNRGGSTVLWEAQEIFKEYIDHYDSRQQLLKLTQKTLNELIFDEGVKGDNKEHLEDLYKKTKAQINDISTKKKSAKNIGSDCCDIIDQLCKHLTIENNLKPRLIQLTASRHSQQPRQQESEVYSFDGLIDGDIGSLSHLGQLEGLSATISKLSSAFVHVQLDDVPELEILIMKQTVTNLRGAGSLLEWYRVGQVVDVHIINDKKCSITIVD